MPRLLSSYAANKRVEDGLRRKQEQIRQEYVRARHRYMDETDKLINDLIQIHVKTPSAFHRSTPPNSAPSYIRAGRGGVYPSQTQGIQLPHHLSSQQQQQTTAEILEETSHALRSRPREDLGPPNVPAFNLDENERVGAGGSRSAPVRRAMQGAVPASGVTNPQPPVVQIRGNEVFYQYDNGKRPSGWKKIEPAYRTKVLLHRNNTVSQALLRQQNLVAASTTETSADNDVEAGTRVESSSVTRKRSLFGAEARRDSELYGRRDSLFSRRSSRRGSRFFEDMEDDFEEDLRAERFAKLMQQQLSPGHTPRMLDGWTIMNWCLWNKRSEKPIWATKRYMEKKRREVKKYEATRAREKKDALPVKPSSAKTRSKEITAGPNGNERERHQEPRRAKSVPLQGRETSRLEGVHEEDEVEEEETTAEGEIQADKHLKLLEPPDRGILRPTTSVLRSSHLDNGLSHGEKDEASRPKTTHSRRRVALDSFIHHKESLPNAEGSKGVSQDRGHVNHGNSDDVKSESGPPSHRSATGTGGEKNEGERRRTISINECPQIVDSSQQGPQSPRPPSTSLVHSRVVGQRNDLEDRMPGLAATRIATNISNAAKKPLTTKKTQNLKKLNSVQAGTVIFPKVKSVVPELGTDSPRQL